MFYNNQLIKTLDLSSCAYNLYFKEHSFDGSAIETIKLYGGFSIHLMEYALANTSNLKSLTDFKLGVFSNTEYAFSNSAIEIVEITEANASSPKIAKSMFDGCKNLKTISYPDSIVSLDDKAFKGCSSLTEFDIKENITSIGLDCFDGCVNLSTIKSYRTTAPTTVTYSFGEISSSSYAGYNNRNQVDDYGDPYNKLYIPANSVGYLSDEKTGLHGWGILVNSVYGNFEVNETL